jgi:hypothetical protein
MMRITAETTSHQRFIRAPNREYRRSPPSRAVQPQRDPVDCFRSSDSGNTESPRIEANLRGYSDTTAIHHRRELSSQQRDPVSVTPL